MAQTTQTTPNKHNLLLLALLAINAIVLMQLMGGRKQQTQQAKAQPPAVILENADKEFKKHNYKLAYRLYDEVANKEKETPLGAKALLGKARGMRDATGTYHTWYGTEATHKNDNLALDTYKLLISRYKDKEIPEIAVAKREQRALQIAMDKTGSKGWKYQLLDSLVRFSRSLGMGRYSYFFALLLLTLMIKLITWKLSAVQYKGMRDMQRMQPIVKEMQEKYKGDPRAMNAKVMEAYKREGINPLMGCLPLVVQIPIMALVFYAIRDYQLQFENGIFLWINGAVHAKLGTIMLFGHKIPFIGANLAQPDIPLVILYTISMFITQKLTVVDPTQAQQQKIMTIFMPLMLAFFFWRFASGFLLYWLMLNLVMTAHQYYVLKAHAPEPAPLVVESTTATPTARARTKRRRRH